MVMKHNGEPSGSARSGVRAARLLTSVAVIAAASAGLAETVGFWDFRDGEPGSDVATVTSSLGETVYVSGVAKKTNGDQGVLPKFSADSPGKIKDGQNGRIICEAPQSVDFRYVSRSVRQGGYIDLPGVADAISGQGDFTIEYFVKQNADYSYYEEGDGNWDQRSKTMLYLEGRSGCGAFKQIMPQSVSTSTKHALGVLMQVYKRGDLIGDNQNGMWNVDLCDDQWHHIALVYSETNATTKTGKLAFYWDRTVACEAAYCNDPEGATGLKLRIGSGYRDANGADKTSTEPVNASISALRVSDQALAANQFLYEAGPYDLDPSGTIALLTFTNRTAGASADRIAYDATDLALLREAGGTGVVLDGIDEGVLPAYDDDVPGRYIFSSGERATILATDYKSLKFTSKGEGTSVAESSKGVGGGCVNFPSLGSVLGMQQSYTVEMFIKDEDWSEWQWESGLFYFRSATNGVTVVNQCNVSSVKPGMAYGYVKMQNGSAAYHGTSMRDGKWHHVALVFDGTLQRQTMYLDYVAGTSVAYVNGYAQDQRFVLGCRDNINSYCWHGKIAGVRIVPRALAAKEFMVASDYKRPAGTVFAVNFNEGAGQDGKSFVNLPEDQYPPVDAAVKASFQDGTVEALRVRYGLHREAFPQFSEGLHARTGRLVEWGGETVWENLAGCRFIGCNSLSSGTANRYYAGTELCVRGSTDPARNPASWTMEAFVRPEYDGQDNALLFAKAAVADQHASPRPYPEYCWLLSRDYDGRLNLKWTEQAEDESYEYTAGSTDYYKSVKTADAVLKEHRWHHVALSYDRPTKTFRLYVNRRLVLEQATGGRELFDSTHDYFFSRICASTGFEGWMDEIRFSGAALAPADFESLGKVGLVIICR